MGQVPFDLIIGRGRLASHLSYFLSLAEHPYPILIWHREQSKQDLAELLSNARAIFLGINDDALADFIAELPESSKAVHFSGARTFRKVLGAHPLMTFSTELYTKDVYEKIPFVVDQSKEKFAEFFPSLTNEVHEIEPEKKALYHAFCVLSGNFTTIMWSALAEEMKNRLDLPPRILNSFLTKTAENTLKNRFAALTGPLARGDKQVIETHLAVLKETPWHQLYKDLIQTYERFAK